MRDFSKLDPSVHMLKWLADNPYEAIFTEVEQTLQNQVPGSQLVSFVVASNPQWLSGGRKNPSDPSKVILVRTGVAFEFQLSVREPDGPTHELSGVFTWVGTGLDDPPNARQRIWFDIGATLDSHGSEGELMGRLTSE